MKIPRSMLVETVMERKGEKMVMAGNGPLYCKVPNLIPVGVFVGINDHGFIRIGHRKSYKRSPKIRRTQNLVGLAREDGPLQTWIAIVDHHDQ